MKDRFSHPLSGQPDQYQAWMQKEHARLFGTWDHYSTGRLVRLCSRFNECLLLRTIVGSPSLGTFSDVGCATGRFYRYVLKVWPSLQYKGFDISEAAIEQARRLYPQTSFTVFNGRIESEPEIRSDVVFCRDVVHHQEDPRQFLSGLYDVTGKYLVLRVRTREKGATVLDTSQSCQYTYGLWVPYIVFNTSELIELLQSFTPSPAGITLWRHPSVLGGQNSRFLPKELYYPETGTAETAVLVEKGTGEGNGDTQITVETRPEERERSSWAPWLRRLASRWGP